MDGNQSAVALVRNELLAKVIPEAIILKISTDLVIAGLQHRFYRQSSMGFAGTVGTFHPQGPGVLAREHDVGFLQQLDKGPMRIE